MNRTLPQKYSMAEGNLPTTGGELEVKNEFPATGEKKHQGKTSLW